MISEEVALIKQITEVERVIEDENTITIFLSGQFLRSKILIRKKGKPWFRIFQHHLNIGMFLFEGGICLDGSGISRILYKFFREGQFYMATLYLISYIKYNRDLMY